MQKNTKTVPDSLGTDGEKYLPLQTSLDFLLSSLNPLEIFCFLTFHRFVHFDLSIVAVLGNIVTSNYSLD